MLVIALPEQSVPAATSENGLPTVAPFNGNEIARFVVVVAFPTVIATLVVHGAPFTPHDFTCRVWLPTVADTLTAIDAPFTVKTLGLLSRE